MDAIRTEGLTRRFGETTAVDGLTLSVAPGEIFGLVGPDGAGKTTTMRLLAAILDPTGGDAWVLGNSVRDDAAKIHERIGYMSQRFGLYADLTVLENLHFHADLYGVPRRDRAPRFEELFAFSGLGPFRNRFAGNLSGGMKQKLGLSCALVHTPGLLLLDEPTSGVDPVSRRDFWRILHRLLAEGVTVFVSTTYLDEAERCRRVGLLHRGRLLAAGSPEEVRALFRGALLEIRCAEPRRAATLLRQTFPAAAVGLFGDRVHIGVRDLPDPVDKVKAALSGAAVPFDSVLPVPPSLEDVFVSVLGRDGGGVE
ncbi:MAG: ABC transporter ATP-binding protein [bacterium]|jgi:ABC-2 type transport system ATP-binding protein